MKLRLLGIVLLWAVTTSTALAQTCDTEGVWLQVLGSGGPELSSRRAATSYLLWVDGKARLLLDTGPGSALNFYNTGASVADLEAILYSHLHASHSADLASLIEASANSGRKQALPIYGPTGNRFMPSTVGMVRLLFDAKRGVYRYLGDYVSPLGNNTFKLQPHNIGLRPGITPGKPGTRAGEVQMVRQSTDMQLLATRVKHGDIPALAWRLNIRDKSIVISGDATGEYGNLEKLANNADLFIAHHAIAESSKVNQQHRYMSPSIIGRIAYRANVRHVVLAHRTLDTLGKEKDSTSAIKSKYAGIISFANDMDCFQP